MFAIDPESMDIVREAEPMITVGTTSAGGFSPFLPLNGTEVRDFVRTDEWLSACRGVALVSSSPCADAVVPNAFRMHLDAIRA